MADINKNRAFFMDRSQIILKMSAEDAVANYHKRAHELIALLFQNSAKMLNLQEGQDYQTMKEFLYFSMCVDGMPICQNGETRNVSLINCLQKKE